ncbi:MAG: hypothetical protein ACRDMV_15010 [Streptosporangiales bacterium]
MSEDSHMPTGECWFCRDERGADSPPGGWIHQDAHWNAWHCLAGWGPAGTVIVESRRHFLDFATMDTGEARTFAPLLGRLVTAIKQAVAAHRVYTWSTMDAYPHFHLWLVPWWQEGQARGPRYLLGSMDAGQCTAGDALDTAARLRGHLAGPGAAVRERR